MVSLNGIDFSIINQSSHHFWNLFWQSIYENWYEFPIVILSVIWRCVWTNRHFIIHLIKSKIDELLLKSSLLHLPCEYWVAQMQSRLWNWYSPWSAPEKGEIYFFLIKVLNTSVQKKNKCILHYQKKNQKI